MQLRSESWLALGASVVGTSHIARGLPCQDSHAGGVSGKLLILAVADGAGSASHAEQGSALAVRESVQFLSGRIANVAPPDEPAWVTLFHDLLGSLRGTIEAEAETAGATAADFATTLLLAVATEAHIATSQVGDGAIVLKPRAGALRTLRPGAVAGEYVNETTFITSSAALAESACSVFAGAEVDGIALLTDGVQFVAISRASCAPHGPFFDPIFRFAGRPDCDPEELTRLLDAGWMNDLTDDDKTLVVAVRAGDSAGEAA